jgi:uncharacterized protein
VSLPLPDRNNRLRQWKTWGLLVILVLAGAASPWLMAPQYPRRLVIATGRPDGAYYAFAEQYRDILARDGVSLEIRPTAGSIENRKLLQAPDGQVSLAFIQGGTTPGGTTGLQSLASLYREPLWVFTRGDANLSRLTQLGGRRIAIGPEGSGTRAIAELLLGQNGIETGDAVGSAIVSLGGQDAARALRNGEVDAAFFVVAPRAALVHELLADREVHLMDFARAAAYERRYPFLSRVTLAEGMVDLERNLPARDVQLIAPTANLVARSDLHPALVPLLLKAAEEIHEPGGLLEQPNEFPSALHVDLPLNSQARQYLKSGPSMLYRYLPFSLAAGIDRAKLMLLPLCTLLFPLLKAAPPVYRWRIRYRIYRWYRVLRQIDEQVKTADAGADFAAETAHLHTLENELAEVSVPLSYMEEVYNLRMHVEFVLRRLERLRGGAARRMRDAA